MSGEYWLVAVQNPADSIRGALRRIDAAVHRGKGGKRLADVSYFAIPELKVGTVDQLMVRATRAPCSPRCSAALTRCNLAASGAER